MGSAAIDEAAVLARFDKLVEDGTVFYAEDMERVYHEDDGFKLEFRLTSALKSKPAAVEDNTALEHADADTSKDTTSSKTGPSKIEFDKDGCLPGGDISIAGYEVAPVRGTHVLMFNKFCAYRPHLLLLTNDGRRRQFEGLDESDLGAARTVLKGLSRGRRRDGGDGKGEGEGEEGDSGQEYLVIFNCGKEGGCSRLHKHMQIIPAPEAIPLWPDTVGSETSAGGEQQPPFRYFVHRFSESAADDVTDSLPSAAELAAEYRRMLRQATELFPEREEAVEEDGNGREVAVPHNVILSGRWMVVIPRVRAVVGGAGVNAAGMLGVVWASEGEIVEKWKGLGPRWVLGEVGVRV